MCNVPMRLLQLGTGIHTAVIYMSLGRRQCTSPILNDSYLTIIAKEAQILTRSDVELCPCFQ